MTPKPIMLPISRGILEHKDRMGPAIWEFLWFVDRVTEDVPDGAGKFQGLVLGGHPVSLAQIAGDLKEHVDTAKRNVRALESHGYIVRRLLPENRRAYSVVNSMKWFRRDHREGENAPAQVDVRAKMHPARGQECTHREGENAPANKETLQYATKNSTKSVRVRPSLEEVSAYCEERNNQVDPQKWMDHYTANGWKVGRNSMRDWKASVRTWERNGITSSADKRERAFEEARQRSREKDDVIGVPDPSQEAAVCRRCGGEGTIRQASHVPGPRLLPCPECDPLGTAGASRPVEPENRSTLRTLAR